MKFKSQGATLTLYLGALTALVPLSLDLYLPSLPAIQRAFNATTGEVQATLSAFIVASAASQLIYGPLSDRYGRRPVLLAGLCFYVAATLACVLAHSIGQLIFARFVQALGAGATAVIARAIVRDLFSAEAAAQTLARMATIMAVVPAIAPMIGGVAQTAFGWHVIFFGMSIGGFLLAATTFTRLPETLSPVYRQSTRPMAILGHFGRLLRHRIFVTYVLIAGFTMGGFFSFLSGASFVLQNGFGLSPTVFGFCFALIIVGYIAGTLVGGKLTRRIGIRNMLRIGTIACIAGGVSMVVAFLAAPSVASIVVPMMLYGFGSGTSLPQSFAGALTPFPEIAGTASALMGFLQAAIAASVGVYVGHAISDGAWPMVACIATMGLLTFLTAQTLPAARKTPD